MNERGSRAPRKTDLGHRQRHDLRARRRRSRLTASPGPPSSPSATSAATRRQTAASALRSSATTSRRAGSPSRQRRRLRARGRGAQAADPLHPRRPRPDRQPHRLRHGQLRRVLDDRRRPLVKSCMLLAVQADGATIETVEGLADGEELTKLQQAFSDHHALQCGYCTPGMLMSATALLRENPQPDRRGDQEGPPGQHLPLHRLLEHLRGRQGGVGMSATTTIAPESRGRGAGRGRGRARASRARRTGASSRARASSSTTSSGTAWATSTSSARRTRTRTSRRSTSRRQRRCRGVYGTLTGEEVASLTDPFFQISTAPGANLKDYALAVGKVRYVGEAIVARRRRDARARARRVGARRGRVRAARRRHRRAHARRTTASR